MGLRVYHYRGSTHSPMDRGAGFTDFVDADEFVEWIVDHKGFTVIESIEPYGVERPFKAKIGNPEKVG